MSPRAYHDAIFNELAAAIQHVFTALSIAVNLLLLRILFTSQRRDIGSYRYVIAFFAFSDLYCSIVHWLVYPVPEMHGNAFVMRGHGLIHSLVGPSLYGTAYIQAFPILVAHFVYRTLLIRSPSSLNEPAPFFAVMLLVTLACSCFGFIDGYVLGGPDEETLRILAPFFAGNTSSPVVHSLDTAHDHIQIMYWAGETYSGPRWNALFGLLITAIIMVSAYITIVCCGLLISTFLKDHAASKKTLDLHRQVFRSLVYQSIYPLITSYSPLTICVFLPVFGLNFTWVAFATPVTCAMRPLFNPLFLIYCVKEYRNAFLRQICCNMFCVRKTNSAAASNSQANAISISAYKH